MTVMLNSMSAAEERREVRWNTFLASLAPWEVHSLMRQSELNGDSMELFLHDQFVYGEISLRDVRTVLSVEAS